MQHGLHRALQRARQADDRELAGRVRDEGHRLVFLLNGLIRMSRLYQSDNAAFEQPASDPSAVSVESSAARPVEIVRMVTCDGPRCVGGTAD
jgi:hypothetical protein